MDKTVEEHIKAIYEIINKNLDEISSPDISHISISMRYITELLGKELLKKEKQWYILHSDLHVNSVKVDFSILAWNIIDIFHILSIANNFIVKKIICKLYEKYPKVDNYFNFNVENSKTKKMSIMIKKVKLVNTKPISYEVIFREDNGKDGNFLMAFSSEIFIPGNLYKVDIFYCSNTMNHKYFFLYKKERYINKINFIISEKIWKSIYEVESFYSFIIKKHNLYSLLDELHYKNKIEKKWPLGLDSNLNIIKAISQIVNNDKYSISRIYKNSYKSYYPLLLSPFVNKPPKSFLPKNIISLLLDYYSLDEETIQDYKYMQKLDKELRNKKLLALKNDGVILTTKKYEGYGITVKHKLISTINNFEFLSTIKTICKNAKIIIAPAGHGKSTYVIDEIIGMNKDKNIILFTPTYKAQEVYRKIQKYKNIHIMNIQKITKGNAFPLADIYIFDEISMYTQNDFRQISHIKDKEIFLVGDPYQLPPIIGHQFSRYIEYFDNGSEVSLENNYRIKDSSMKQDIEYLLKDLRKNKIQVTNEKYNNIFEVYATYEQLYKKLQCYSNYSILVSKNQGITGVNNINRIITKRTKDHYNKGDDIIFNDKVKTFKCLPDMEWVYPSKREMIKDFKITKEKNIEYIEYFFSNNKNIKVEKYEEPFDLSVCMTVHRSQGQDIENVIVIVDSIRDIDFNWLYTACSRTTDKLVILIKDDLFINHKEVQNSIPKQTKNL